MSRSDDPRPSPPSEEAGASITDRVRMSGWMLALLNVVPRILFSTVFDCPSLPAPFNTGLILTFAGLVSLGVSWLIAETHPLQRYFLFGGLLTVAISVILVAIGEFHLIQVGLQASGCQAVP